MSLEKSPNTIHIQEVEHDDTKKVIQLQIKGMTCSVCSNSVEKALMEKPFVITAEVSEMTNFAYVTVDLKLNFNDKEIIETIEDLGFEASIVNSFQKIEHEKESTKLFRNCAKFILFASPIFFTNFRSYMSPDSETGIMCQDHISQYAVIQVFFATLIQFKVAKSYNQAAYSACIHRSGGMSLLIASSTWILYLYSMYDIFAICQNLSNHLTEPHLFFQTIALIFILIHNFIRFSIISQRRNFIAKIFIISSYATCLS